MSIWGTTFHLEDDTAPYADFHGQALNEHGDAYFTTLGTLPETPRAGYLWFSEALGFGVPLLRVDAGDGESNVLQLFIDPTQAKRIRDHLDQWLKAVEKEVSR